ncbi:MAG: hypothetical protein ACYDAL_16355 [Candidatus Dormibacteraceae bacterium]
MIEMFKAFQDYFCTPAPLWFVLLFFLLNILVIDTLASRVRKRFDDLATFKPSEPPPAKPSPPWEGP